MASLTGKTALVTGATSGIGFGIARHFLSLGASVVIHGRDQAEADRAATELSADGTVCTGVSADLRDVAACRAMMRAAIAWKGGLDVLVNNAGIFAPHPITETTYEEWQEGWRDTLGVNLVGAANVTWCAVPHMLRAGGGRIVNVSSRGAFRGEPSQPAYGASKAGLIAFGQSLARDLGPHGITVAAVAPGFTETDMAVEALSGERGAARRAESPLGRVASPEEVAAAVVFLASPAATMATGAVLDVNGASYLRM
jgi:NAD(P)-dependent dehydrogenase (short-subunit alcohol dehydrogenase family)